MRGRLPAAPQVHLQLPLPEVRAAGRRAQACEVTTPAAGSCGVETADLPLPSEWLPRFPKPLVAMAGEGEGGLWLEGSGRVGVHLLEQPPLAFLLRDRELVCGACGCEWLVAAGCWVCG